MVADEQQSTRSLRSHMTVMFISAIHRFNPRRFSVFRLTGDSALGDTVFSMRCALGFLAVFLYAAEPACAKLDVCNKAAGPAKVALGRFDGAGWMSQGWWTIAPHTCATLIDHPLVARYYYLYATDGGAGSWSGSRAFCVGDPGQILDCQILDSRTR